MNLSYRGRREYARTFLEPWRDKEEVIALTVLRTLLSIMARGEARATYIASKLTEELSILRGLEEVVLTNPNLYAYVNNRNEKMTKKYQIQAKKDLAKAKASIKVNSSILIGSTLLDLLVKSGANVIMIPILNSVKSVVFTAEAEAILTDIRYRLINTSITFKPLVEPPIPHTQWVGSGGHQVIKDIPLVKFKYNKDLKYVKKLQFPKRMVDVINNISNTKWSINTKVLEVIESIVDNGMIDNSSTSDYPFLIGGLPMVDIKDPYDVFPKHLAEGYDTNTGEFTEKKWLAIWLKQIEEEKLKAGANLSKRITLSLAINLANQFKEYPSIYFSYTVDFRGRLYPLQGILNPQGQGYIKSLLRFSEGVEYNQEAERWMKIHLANNLGFDKLTYEDRIKEIDKRKGEIIEISKDPIRNTSLWKDADSPYLYLSGAIDYGNYLTGNSTLCYTPISLDATCSGIQVYSGLLLDKEGAEAVNVINKEGKPSDIYQQVADKVNGYIEAGEYPSTIEYTTSDGTTHSISTREAIESMRGNIKRKHTKRNVMTTPYSVTKRGMFNQLKEVLVDEEQAGNKWWKGDYWVVAKILTELNMRGIGEVVKGAKIGQQYLKDLVKITNDTNDALLFYTPIFNFPVYQNVRVTKTNRVTTPLGKLVLLSQTDKIHKQRQLSGVAPNIIHSLDSTLMYLTVEKLIKEGVTDYMLIHDSFGVPATQVEKLNRAVRSAYIELFESEPLNYITKQVAGVEIKEGVIINDLDLNDVTKSNYIFS